MSIIQKTRDFDRIAEMPRRLWESYGEKAAEILTDEFKKPWGEQSLFPIQGAALADISNYGGLFAPIRVGGGKTLVTFLSPHVLGSKRPMLLAPAKLVRDKTPKAMRDSSWHWRICRHLRVQSYESLGRVSGTALLDEYKPDLIIADEAHKLKNRKAAVTRRVSRYMEDNFHCRFVGLSGTFERKSIKDYAHLLLWASRHSGYYPLPYAYTEMCEWSDCLDLKDVAVRPSPGCFLSLPGADDLDPWVAAKRAFRRRLVETPGVVASNNESKVDCSLLVSDADVPGDFYEVDRLIDNVRETYETPEGFALSEAPQVWQHVRQLALGFYYRYVIPPPTEWFDARRVWAQFVREVLKKGRLDSELQVAQQYLASVELLNWQREKEKFKPETEAVWVDKTVVDFCARWLRNHPRGIAWVDYIEFGKELGRASGRPFFSAEACDDKGNFVENAKGPIIASVHSVGEGLNLQTNWSDNLIASPMRNAGKLEQILGRTHRYGQTADEVTCSVLVNCVEHIRAIHENVEEASHVFDKMGDRYKILTCDLSLRAVEHYLDATKGRFSNGI